MSFVLEVISPQKIEFSHEIDLCIIPGIEGDFGVLKKHMPFLTSLRIGILYIYLKNKLESTFLLSGGIAEISNNKCTILTEDFADTKKVDLYALKKLVETDENKKNLVNQKIKSLQKFYYS